MTRSRIVPRSRPLFITLVGYLFIAAGVLGVAYHASTLTTQAVRADEIWVLLLRLAAIVIGLFLLRGAGWARWLAVAWMAYHVVLSAWHSVSEVLVHAALLVAIAYALFRAAASRFFVADRST